MTGKTAIVGNGDSIMVFKATGVATFPAEDEKKAREISEISGCCAIADDSGVCVDALDGAPGI